MVTKKTSKKKAKQATTKSTSSSNADNSKIGAILQYIFPIGLIWFFVDEELKKNKFVKFHVKQALILVIISVGLSIIFAILPFLMLIGWIVHIGVFVLWVIGLIAAINGEEKELPLVGKYASKFTF